MRLCEEFLLAFMFDERAVQAREVSHKQTLPTADSSRPAESRELINPASSKSWRSTWRDRGARKPGSGWGPGWVMADCPS